MQSDSSTRVGLVKADPSKESEGGVRLAVCVNTYFRPEGLERFLRALARSTFANPAPRINVVVVDNDAEGSAREVCERARDWFPYELHYAVEKRRGISQARNTALSVAMPIADFVAITDDDAEPTPEWLAELLRVQKLYRADVVSGPSLPRFLEEPPTWILEGHFFEGPRRKTGTRVETAAAGNALVRCGALEQMGRFFDENLGLTGCEDTEFFRRMFRDGNKMVWSDEAITYECFPPTRMTLRWLLQRKYRIANGRGSSELRRLEGVTCLWVFVSGLKCLVRGAVHLAFAIALRQGAVARVHALVKLVSGVGWLTGLLGLRYREYAHLHGK
jgi:glycosyltransferase involved in cell wall biosynthesis